MASASEDSPGYFANNAPRIISYALFLLFNLGLFVYAAELYDGSGPFVQIARGCGAIINFNGAFCLLPMMRLFISWVRKTPIASYLALEDSIDFHRLSGHLMFGAAVIHTAAYFVLYEDSQRSLWDNLTGSTAAWTGMVLVVVFVVIWVFALERSRKRWPYEAFLTAHALGIALAALLLVHSPNYWKWFLVGGTGYLLDRFVRFWRMRNPSRIVSARRLPSRVTELAIARPPGWDYRPGDFVWVLIPAVSRLEWHPFTISSAPERPDTFTLHVRTLGDWTDQLQRSADTLADTRVFFDGPHGAPANDIFASRVAVLVAAGIGVTPFASILQSLLARRNDPGDGRSSPPAAGPPALALERVYFYWINRDHQAFEWFTEMMAELEQKDIHDFFEIHLYITEPPAGELPPLTLVGKPSWDTELARIRAAHGTEGVGFFYCGPRPLARILHIHCEELGWSFKEEHF